MHIPIVHHAESFHETRYPAPQLLAPPHNSRHWWHVLVQGGTPGCLFSSQLLVKQHLGIIQLFAAHSQQSGVVVFEEVVDYGTIQKRSHHV